MNSKSMIDFKKYLSIFEEIQSTEYVGFITAHSEEEEYEDYHERKIRLEKIERCVADPSMPIAPPGASWAWPNPKHVFRAVVVGDEREKLFMEGLLEFNKVRIAETGDVYLSCEKDCCYTTILFKTAPPVPKKEA